MGSRATFALDGDVARQPRHAGSPGQRRVRRDVGNRREVGIVGLLADRAGGEAGEAGAVLEQPVEVPRRDELGVRLAVHVHELREHELHVVFTDVALDVLAGARRGEWLGSHGRKVSPAPDPANVGWGPHVYRTWDVARREVWGAHMPRIGELPHTPRCVP